MTEIGIGSTVWYFDINRRKYPPTKPGARYSSGPPIWREHWRPEKIASETSRSWITEHGNKVPKKGERRGWAFSQEEIERLAYVEENRFRIVRVVENIRDPDLLKAVADLIGYEPPSTGSGQ